MKWGKIGTINNHLAGALLLATCLTGRQVVTMPPQTAFSDMRLGLFVHYTYVGRPYQWGCTMWSDGSPVASLDELADNLDVRDMVRTAATMRAQYLQFTTWHANMNVLFPSAMMARKLPGHCSRPLGGR